MPTLDSCHFQVVRALQKDGWNVFEKPKYIYDDDAAIFIDIEAVKVSNGGISTGRQIYVEVKCFLGHNVSQELYIALGQGLIYRASLLKKRIEIPLFIAIPAAIYDNIFNTTVQQIFRENRIKLLVIDLKTETITQWIE